jgi:hypothetical protein
VLVFLFFLEKGNTSFGAIEIKRMSKRLNWERPEIGVKAMVQEFCLKEIEAKAADIFANE